MLSTREEEPEVEDNTDGEYQLVPVNVPIEYGILSATTDLPKCLAVAGVRLFGSAGMMFGKMYAKTCLHDLSSKSGTEVVKGLAQSTIISATIEAQAAKQIIVRIPVVGTAFADRFMKSVGGGFDDIAAAGLSSTVRTVGLRGRILVIAASLLVHEITEFSWLLASGSVSLSDFLARTGLHISSALGSLGGGVLGTAVGTFAMPGLGTGIGSIAGSLVGASLAEYAVSSLTSPAVEQIEASSQPTGCIELILEAPSTEPITSKSINIECELPDEVLNDAKPPPPLQGGAESDSSSTVSTESDSIEEEDDPCEDPFILLNSDDYSDDESSE